VGDGDRVEPEFRPGILLPRQALDGPGSDLARAERLVRDGLERDPEHQEGPLGYYVLADILNRTGRGAEAQQALSNGRRIQQQME